MKKLCLMNIFSTQYDLEHLEKWFGNKTPKTVQKTKKVKN
jgi:hypothetical protein